MKKSRMISGWHFRLIHALMLLDMLLVAFLRNPSLPGSIRSLKKLMQKRDQFQILEASADGYDAGRDVALGNKDISTRENFFLDTDFSKDKLHQPAVSYEVFHTRRSGCAYGATSDVYVDTEGFIYSCPFCHQQLYRELNQNLHTLLHEQKKRGCFEFATSVTIIQPQKLAI